MSENYKGIKFTYIKKVRVAPKHPKLNELKYWCGIFHQNNFAPQYPGGSSGNLSFRTLKNSDSFIITCSHTSLNMYMKDSEFSKVTGCIPLTKTVEANGVKSPSSESIMHYLIYRNYKEINAVFHGHSEEIMDKAIKRGFPVTKNEEEYGTVQLAEDVSKLIKYNKFVILKNHGFISCGETMKEAGERISEILKFT